LTIGTPHELRLPSNGSASIGRFNPALSRVR
jgi:hypothetical protein